MFSWVLFYVLMFLCISFSMGCAISPVILDWLKSRYVAYPCDLLFHDTILSRGIATSHMSWSVAYSAFSYMFVRVYSGRGLRLVRNSLDIFGCWSMMRVGFHKVFVAQLIVRSWNQGRLATSDTNLNVKMKFSTSKYHAKDEATCICRRRSISINIFSGLEECIGVDL